ncbi:hypothetical protein, partial [Blastochloris sulfoviridis]|uniref:hypothetical protein n=1 Tax=Blastochloris sulfoviridis TaxID=50712 RepID=UPI001AEE67EA
QSPVPLAPSPILRIRIEGTDRFSTSGPCHAFLHPIALGGFSLLGPASSFINEYRVSAERLGLAAKIARDERFFSKISTTERPRKRAAELLMFRNLDT